MITSWNKPLDNLSIAGGLQTKEWCIKSWVKYVSCTINYNYNTFFIYPLMSLEKTEQMLVILRAKGVLSLLVLLSVIKNCSKQADFKWNYAVAARQYNQEML